MWFQSKMYFRIEIKFILKKNLYMASWVFLEFHWIGGGTQSCFRVKNHTLFKSI